MSTRTCIRYLLACCAAALALGLLSGCAVPRRIDSDVQSFTGTAAAVRPATYRFERLPSQLQSPLQDQLEAMAVPALAEVGLTQAAGASGTGQARYVAQVSAQRMVLQAAYPYPHMGGFWGRRDGFPWGSLSLEPTWYRHAVHLLLREPGSGQVVYETSATFDGPWNDSNNLLPVLLQAALQDYPQPPSGPRKVIIELPGGFAPVP